MNFIVSAFAKSSLKLGHRHVDAEERDQVLLITERLE